MGKGAVKEFENKNNFDPMGCEKETKIDRLSNLPSELLDLILVKLPLKDAIRTSILSKEWRYKWGSLSQFVFDDEKASWDNKASWGNIRKIVYQYLLLHNDAIDKFSLCADCKEDYCDLYQWIYFLSKKGVKEFVLEQCCYWSILELPSSMFAFQQLRHLKLITCDIELPHAFIELNSLASLHLIDVYIEDDTLENLISSCPVLETLILIKIRCLEHLKIHGPNLKYFELFSNFRNISFRSTQSLAIVDLKIILKHFQDKENTGEQQGQEKACNLLTALGSLPGLERLTLLTHFFMLLDINDASKRLHNAFNNVIAVDLLDIYLFDAQMVKTTFSVIQMFPNLKELNVKVIIYDLLKIIVKFLNGQEQVNFSFKKLKAVGMETSDNMGVACLFLKLIICCSPMLETLTITKDGKTKLSEKKLGKMFQRLKGSSDTVKVMYKETKSHKSYIF